MPTEFTPANAEPIMRLDLGDNGGALAPLSYEELIDWIKDNEGHWSWLRNRSFGSHDAVLRDPLVLLEKALRNAQEALSMMQGNPDHSRNLLKSVADSINEVYVNRGLPHISTPIFIRVDEVRSAYGDLAASFYTAARMDRPGTTYQPSELSAWKGLVEAIGDRYGALDSEGGNVRAIESSIDDLRGRVENLLGDGRSKYDELHRNYESIVLEISAQKEGQLSDFEAAQNGRGEEFGVLVSEHKRELEALRKTFREELALRAPAEYWTGKRFAHRWMAAISGFFSFIAIVGCAYFLSVEVKSILDNTKVGTVPDYWRVAVLALISVFAVWAVRLVVRIFLSHVHLATDASERVVMLKTYLSLIEGGQLKADAERQLILNALFRPASDGIVKDEGVPPSFLDILTKTK
ncbi:DUF6161 domain-containing protein [Lysobacter yananisis]|uniref:DUF6161 domain-containing protein n=1 Tax=Lysobacter yananisis TaxID=1003114 RepID=A0ABY9PDX2_9GAMM|nr:DUF6161 domain-containing protein [Lysobacter yananisis]WMT05273.1 DUF6161 domain-containing protein [Lysobacter yananisis]